MAFNTTFHTAQLTAAQSQLVTLSLHSADPPTTANEVTSAAQRATLGWPPPSGDSMQATESVSVDAGSTVAAVGFWDSSAAFQGGGPIDGEPETFTNPGTADVTVTVTES